MSLVSNYVVYHKYVLYFEILSNKTCFYKPGDFVMSCTGEHLSCFCGDEKREVLRVTRRYKKLMCSPYVCVRTHGCLDRHM